MLCSFCFFFPTPTNNKNEDGIIGGHHNKADNILHDDDGAHYKYDENDKNIKQYASVVKKTLKRWWWFGGIPRARISHGLKRELLWTNPELNHAPCFAPCFLEDEKECYDLGKEEEEWSVWTSMDTVTASTSSLSTNKTMLLKGVPDRPLYWELARRMYLISNANHSTGATAWFVPAEHFDLSEVAPPSIPLPPLLNQLSVDSCSEYFSLSSDDSDPGDANTDRIIYALLGLRQTVGTAIGYLPPSLSQLMEASDRPYQRRPKDQNETKNHSNSTNRHRISHQKGKIGGGGGRQPQRQPIVLTCAARARAKHAHRCRNGQGFFGSAPRGPVIEQNQAARRIVYRLLTEAAWVNIHSFGGNGNSRPMLEVRVLSGYGARWSANWNENPARPTNVEFFGFLEPQMEDGHEKGWRH